MGQRRPAPSLSRPAIGLAIAALAAVFVFAAVAAPAHAHAGHSHDHDHSHGHGHVDILDVIRRGRADGRARAETAIVTGGAPAARSPLAASTYGPVQPATRCTLKSLSFERAREGDATVKPFVMNTAQVEQLIRAGNPSFTDARFAPHYCIDGRHLKNAVHTPGGDISEFLLALNAYQQVVLKGAALTDEQVYQIMIDFIDLYAIPNERPFYMHSDDHSDHYFKDLLAYNTSIGTRALDKAYTIEGAPAADRDAIMSMALMPDTLGCGHLKRTLKNPAIYETPEALTKSVIKAFYKALWRDRDAGKGAVEFQILPGEHVEGSVAIVHSEAKCGDSVFTFKPNATFGQVFIYHADSLDYIRQTMTRFFCDHKTKLGALPATECRPSALREKMVTIFDAGFASTAGALANARPIDAVKITVDGFPGAKTAALTPADDPESARAAAVALKQDQAKGCPILDVTASVAAASTESDPEKMWRILSIEHAKAFVGDAHIVDVVNHTWSCIDGRSHKAILGTPGGTMSEFILALAAFVKNGFTVANEDTMQALVDLYTEKYTIPYVRQFYMHTDVKSVTKIAAKLGLDATTLGTQLSNPPAHLRPALLEYSATPDYMGCGHIKNTIEQPTTYGIDAQLTKWAVRSFTRALWADTSRGAGRFVYENLPGEHVEGAVLLVKSAGCKDHAAEVAPHQGNLVPGQKPALGDGEAFIFHYADVPMFREWNAKFFTDSVRPAIAAPPATLTSVAYSGMVTEMNSIFQPGLGYTVSKLASTLPMFYDDVSGTKYSEISLAVKADEAAVKGKLQSKKEVLSFHVDLPGLPCSVLTASGFKDIKASLAAKLLLNPSRLLVSNVRCGLQERMRRTLFQTSRVARRGLLASAVVTDGTWTVLTAHVLPPLRFDDKLTLDVMSKRLNDTMNHLTMTVVGYGNVVLRRVDGSDQYPADASGKDYGTVAAPSRFALDAAADLKSYLSTVSAAAGPHPAALDHTKIAKLVAAGKPHFRDVRFAPHYCIDGRHVRGSVHTPGGDISEFLLALSSFQRTVLNNAAISDEQVYQIMTAWIDAFAIPNERPFYMHTDEHSEEYLHKKLGRDLSFDISMPPANEAEEKLLLEAVIDPETHGCGHLKLTLKNPDIYGTSADLTKSVIKAYYRALWRDRAAVPGGLGAVDRQVLPGDHAEGSVLVVSQTKDMGDSVVTFAPNVPSIGQVFLFHADALDFIRQSFVRFFCDHKTKLGAGATAECHSSKIRADMKKIFDGGLAHTAGRLAANRAMDSLAITAPAVGGMAGYKTVSLDLPDDKSLVAKPENEKKCGATDVTASVVAASKEDDPAKLWRILTVDHVKPHIGQPAIVDVARHTWSCIDGRSSKAILGTPGGTISEFLLGVGSFIKKGLTIPNEDTMQALVDLYTSYYTIPWTRQFYMHTDHHSVEAIAAALGVTYADVKPYSPPGKLRPAVLTYSATPKYMGCGHVKMTIQNPGVYGIPAEVTTWAVRSFHRALWADQQRGAGRFVLEVLDGDHHEGAVILVKPAGCAGKTAEVAPHVGELTPGKNVSNGNTEAFVFHAADVPTLRKQNAEFFVSTLRPALKSVPAAIASATVEDIVANITDIFAPGFGFTAGALAGKLPLYQGAVTSGDEAVFKAILQDQVALGSLAPTVASAVVKFVLSVNVDCKTVTAATIDDIKTKLINVIAYRAALVKFSGVKCPDDAVRRRLLQAPSSSITVNLLPGDQQGDKPLNEVVNTLKSQQGNNNFLPGYTSVLTFPATATPVAPTTPTAPTTTTTTTDGASSNQLVIILPVVVSIAAFVVIAVIVWYIVAMKKANRRSTVPKDAYAPSGNPKDAVIPIGDPAAIRGSAPSAKESTAVFDVAIGPEAQAVAKDDGWRVNIF
eukprot:tig00021038_g17585.t1